MGEGPLSAGRALRALLVVAVLLANSFAQGIVYRERWGYLHFENRRLELLRELLGSDAAMQQEVAAALAVPATGEAFAQFGRALARVRGVPADDAFQLRFAMSVFVLPEVADPEANNEQCRVTNLSAFVPCALTLPAGLEVEFEVTDAAGERKWSHRSVGEIPLDDLRMARVTTQVPASELADGRYTVSVTAKLASGGPRPTDPTLRWPMFVQRGFQRRCEAALGTVQKAAPTLSTIHRAMLLGFAEPVRRTYGGLAFDVTSRAVPDLERLERAMANLAAERPVLAGMTGDVETALPAPGDDRLACVLRTADDLGAAGKRTARPLIVFAGASPCYDVGTERPSGPATRGPRWLAAELAHFTATAERDVAFLESPGAGRDYAPALATAIEALKTLLATGDRPVVVVCDREAAAIVALRTPLLRSAVAGLVLMGAGGMTGAMLDALTPLRVRYLTLQGHSGSESIERSLAWVREREKTGEWRGSVAPLAKGPVAWPFGAALGADAIDAFVREIAAR